MASLARVFEADARITGSRHLSGQHDQKAHGRRGLPPGWIQWGTDDPGRVKVGSSSGRLTVDASVADFGSMDQTMAAVEQTANVLERLDRANPSLHGVEAHLTSDLGSHVGGLTEWGWSLNEPPDVNINTNLFPSGTPQWRRSITANHNHGDPDDVVRTIITHEYGHILQRDAAFNAPTPGGLAGATPDRMVKAFANSAVDRAMDSAGVMGPGGSGNWLAMSEYARTNGLEAYAECFTSWAMRDVAPATEVAKALAEQEGWK